MTLNRIHLIILIFVSSFILTRNNSYAISCSADIRLNNLNTPTCYQNDSILKPTYKTVKLQVKQLRNYLNLNPVSTDSLSRVFEYIILNQIIPYWYNTPWSFEGHTSIPQKGSIACGYFVSTVLRDMGIQLNRYHLAQQNPLNEAKTLALDTPIKEYSSSNTNDIICAIQNELKPGLYFIGFENNHVGFLLNQNHQFYLIHSNYLSEDGVLKETIESSEVFHSFNQFHIAELSTNKTLLNHWINQKEVKVIRE